MLKLKQKHGENDDIQIGHFLQFNKKNCITNQRVFIHLQNMEHSGYASDQT